MSRPSKGPRLIKRNGHWYVRDHGGHEESTRIKATGNQPCAAAKTYLEDYLKRHRESTEGSKDFAVLLVSDIINFYIRQQTEAANKNPAKRKTATNIYDNLKPASEWWDGMVLKDVTEENCQAFFEWRQQQPNRVYPGKTISPGTAAKSLTYLSAAITAYFRKFMPEARLLGGRDRAWMVWVPHQDDLPARERYLERDEVARLLLACMGYTWDQGDQRMVRVLLTTKNKLSVAQTKRRRMHMRRLLLIGLYTGTRHETIIKARWDRTPHAPWIDIEAGLFYRLPPGKKDTNKRNPTCKIPAVLLPHLRRWHAQDTARSIPYVLHENGRPLQKIKTGILTLREDAGLGEDVKVHTLRHTCATWLMKRGQNLTAAATFLGMSEVTLKKRYWHFHPEFNHGIDDMFARRSR